jgi:hypothetical protein
VRDAAGIRSAVNDLAKRAIRLSMLKTKIKTKKKLT